MKTQIENTINEIRKGTSALTVSNENNFPNYGSDYKNNHSIGKWEFGENHHQKNHFANWSKDIGRFLLNEEKIQNPNLSLESLVRKD